MVRPNLSLAEAKCREAIDSQARVGTAGGLCLTALSTVEMAACAAEKADVQKFTLEKNGNLHLTAHKGSCLALFTGYGPGLTMAACKSGAPGKNEEFTLTNGQLCSSTLGHPSTPLCLKPEAKKPSGHGHGHGHGEQGGGFDCIANAAALARCQVHFTMCGFRPACNPAPLATLACCNLADRAVFGHTGGRS